MTGDGSTSTGGDTTSTGGDTTTTTTPTTPPPIDIWTPVLQEFMAYDMKFRGGVRVAAGDVSGDGKADIITAPGKGGGPHIRVFDATTGQVYREFMAFGSTFTGGVYVTAGDIDGDGQAEITVSTGANGGARVNTFDGETGRLIRTFAADSNPANWKSWLPTEHASKSATRGPMRSRRRSRRSIRVIGGASISAERVD